MRPNKYAGRCVKCRCAVAAEQGFLTGPPWGAICKRCAPADERAEALQGGTRLVRIEPYGSDTKFLSIRAGAFLGDHFMEFRDLVASFSTYDRDAKTNVAEMHRLLEILDALQKDEWAVQIAPELAAALKAEADDAIKISANASARLDVLRARFAQEKLALRPYQETGVAWLMEILERGGGILADDPGTGKGHPVDEPVLTPSGWRVVGDLVVGDEVIGSDGRPTKVTGVFPRGVLPVFRVSFTDGCSVRVDGDHLWAVKNANDRKRGSPNRVVETRALRPSPTRRWSIPLVAPVAFSERDLPVDPYVLGVLLGDGDLSVDAHARFSSADAEVAQRVRERVFPMRVEGVPDQRSQSVTYRIVLAPGRPNDLAERLRDLRLMGTDCFDKFIPHRYLFAGIEARIELLRGLMDTDGSCDARQGAVEFSSASKQLAEDVAELVRGLGGKARMVARPTWFTRDGVRSQGSTSYRLSIVMPNEINPFALTRKRDAVKPRTKYAPIRLIESVEEDGHAEVVCISVAAPDHLYVAKDYAVTHNTIMLLAAFPENAAVIVVCPVNAKGVWLREATRWRRDLRVNAPETFATWPKAGEILVVTYDALRRSAKDTTIEIEGEEHDFVRCLLTGDPLDGTILVADEGHRLKNTKSATRKAWDAATAATRAEVKVDEKTTRTRGGKALLATGSPVMNKEIELFSLLEACGGVGTRIFGGKKQFRRSVSTGGEAYQLKIREGLLRRTKKEVMKELPPIQYSTVDVEIDAKTRASLDEALAKIVELAVEKKVSDAKKENEGKPVEARVDLDLVREQAQNDVGAAIDLAFDGTIRVPFELISRVKSILATAKVPAALEVLDDLEGDEEDRARPGELFTGFVCDDPICFASAHVLPVETVASRPGWAMIRGGVSAEKRTEISQDFQAGKYRGISLAIKAAGEAITLTRSSRMLINDPEWTPAAMNQLVSRIHRMGQKGRPDEGTTPFGGEEENGSHVQVIRFVADHVLDRRILEILDEKLGIVERTVESAAVGVDYRAAGKASAIMQTLEATTIAKPPAPGAGRRRAVSDAEKATQAILSGSDVLPTNFLMSLRGTFKRDNGLSDTQWIYAVKAVKEAYVLRPAKDEVERWAARGVVLLAQADPDHARELNGAGFSKFDNDLGHEIARCLDGGLLSDDRWRACMNLAHKYRRQIPPKPETPAPVAQEEPEQNPFEIGGGL